MVERLVKEEGLTVGGSTGVNVVAALRVAARPDIKGPVVTIAADLWDRYRSTPWMKAWEEREVEGRRVPAAVPAEGMKKLGPARAARRRDRRDRDLAVHLRARLRLAQARPRARARARVAAARRGRAQLRVPVGQGGVLARRARAALPGADDALFRYTIAAFAASVIAPARAGELIRVWVLKKRHGVPIADTPRSRSPRSCSTACR